jgi:predicted transcriptional regulator
MRRNIDALDEAVALSTRDRIYSTISKNPGLHFREIQRRTEIATGALQYHIDYLQKKHLVRSEKDGKFSRFYAVRGEDVDTELMSLLRQESVRRIVLFLMKRRRATLPQISKEVNLSASTTSFHMQKLVQSEMIVQKNYGKKTYFSLKDKDRILELLLTYNKSFLDELVDNFVDIWEEELVR